MPPPAFLAVLDVEQPLYEIERGADNRLRVDGGDIVIGPGHALTPALLAEWRQALSAAPSRRGAAA